MFSNCHPVNPPARSSRAHVRWMGLSVCCLSASLMCTTYAKALSMCAYLSIRSMTRKTYLLFAFAEYAYADLLRRSTPPSAFRRAAVHGAPLKRIRILATMSQNSAFRAHALGGTHPWLHIDLTSNLIHR